MNKSNSNENILVINSIDNIELEFENENDLISSSSSSSSPTNLTLLPTKQQKRNKSDNHTKTLNIIIIFVILFFGEVARGIIIPTINLYSNEIGGTAKTLGIIISAFSAGRFIATIVLGYLSRHDNYKSIFNASIILCIIGSIWYSFGYIGDEGYSEKSNSPFLMGEFSLVISRFVLGFGAGTLSTARAFLADITAPAERTTWIALSSALQFMGFAISPIIGSFLSFIPPFNFFGIRVDSITSPGWFLTIQNIILFLVILFFFKNPTLSDLDQNGSNNNNNNSNNSINSNISKSKSNDDLNEPLLQNNNNISDDEHDHESYNNDDEERSSLKSSDGLNINNSNTQSIYMVLYKDKRIFINLIIFIVLNFFIRTVLGLYEGLGSELYLKLDTSSDNSTTSGYFFGGLGGLGIVLLLIISWCCKKEWLHDYWILCFGNGIITVGCFITMVHQLTWLRFVIGYICIWGVGFSLSQTVVISMFSKVLSNKIGNASQGTLIGIITASGSLGRVVGPLFTGLLYNPADTLPLFSFAFALSFVLLFSSILLIPQDIIKIKYLNYSGNDQENYNENGYKLIK